MNSSDDEIRGTFLPCFFLFFRSAVSHSGWRWDEDGYFCSNDRLMRGLSSIESQGFWPVTLLEKGHSLINMLREASLKRDSDQYDLSLRNGTSESHCLRGGASPKEKCCARKDLLSCRVVSAGLSPKGESEGSGPSSRDTCPHTYRSCRSNKAVRRARRSSSAFQARRVGITKLLEQTSKPCKRHIATVCTDDTPRSVTAMCGAGRAIGEGLAYRLARFLSLCLRGGVRRSVQKKCAVRNESLSSRARQRLRDGEGRKAQAVEERRVSLLSQRTGLSLLSFHLVVLEVSSCDIALTATPPAFLVPSRSAPL